MISKEFKKIMDEAIHRKYYSQPTQPHNSPYRTPAEKPKEEEKVMSDENKLIKMLIMVSAFIGMCWIGSCTYMSANENNTKLAAEQAKAVEAKAEADKAMFDQMKK